MNQWADKLHLLNRILEVAPLLPLVVVWDRHEGIPQRFKILLYYIELKAFFCILDVISRYVFQNNIYVFHLSTVVSVVVLSRVYIMLINSEKWHKYIVLCVFVFLIVAFADAVFLNGLFDNLNSYSQAFGSIILVAMSLIHIVQISRTRLDLLSQPEFFLSVSVLVYFSYTIITYVVSNIIYSAGYDVATRIKLDRIISAPDAILYAVHMGLLAWMFNFFSLTINPLRALPRWLHYSRWHARPYKMLWQPLNLHQSSTAAT